MRFFPKAMLAASTVLWSMPTASALNWNCGVPEIDGPAGVSVMAVLVSIGVMAYERYKA